MILEGGDDSVLLMQDRIIPPILTIHKNGHDTFSLVLCVVFYLRQKDWKNYVLYGQNMK